MDARHSTVYGDNSGSAVQRDVFVFFFLGAKQQPYEDDRVPLAYGQPRFRPDYNTPEGFRAGEEVKDKMDGEWKELRRMEMLSKGAENPNKAYTEGGLVFLPRKGEHFVVASKQHEMRYNIQDGYL